LRTAETTPAPTPTEVKEQATETKEESKEVSLDQKAEKASFFASLCSCLGGKPAVADTDKPAADSKDDDKEEVEETPETNDAEA